MDSKPETASEPTPAIDAEEPSIPGSDADSESESVEELDRTLALAIKATMDQVLENGLGGFEPINPIQAAFAQLIQSYASGKMGAVDVQQIVRNDDGTFQKSIEDFE